MYELYSDKQRKRIFWGLKMGNNFLKRLGEKILVSDGAMGTMLQKEGLVAGECGEEWNISHKKKVQGVHQAYLEAGCDIIITNTFGGNYFKLEKQGFENKVYEFNFAGAQLAKEVGDNYAGRYVVGDIGPTGEFMKPLGDLGYDDFYKVFKEQILALKEGGVDLVIIETMSALEEIKVALRVAKENTNLPVIASMSFASTKKGFRTMMGVSVREAVSGMKEAGADVIGANCGEGPEEMLEIIKEMRHLTITYLITQPNAGRPKLVQGKTIFDASPEDMAQFVSQSLVAEPNIVGGCCGTTSEHLLKMVERLAEIKERNEKK